MKLSEFKRTLKPGDYLTMLSHSWMPNGRLIGQRRQVVGMNTVDILIETTSKEGTPVKSHLAWPKAADFSLDGNIITYKGGENLVMTYLWERGLSQPEALDQLPNQAMHNAPRPSTLAREASKDDV